MTILESTIELLANELRLDTQLREDLNFDATIEMIINSISYARDTDLCDDETVLEVIMIPAIRSFGVKISRLANFAHWTRHINPVIHSVKIIELLTEVIGDLFNE